MLRLKMFVTAAAVAGGLGLAAAAHAAPLSPVPAETVAGLATPVAFGCGPGFAPNRFGRCRPIGPRLGYGRPRYGYDGPRRGPYRRPYRY